MLHLKNLLITGFVVSCLWLPSQGQDNPLGPAVRWGAELGKADQAASDSLRKLSTEIADFKNRLQLLEENQVRYNGTLKSHLQAMQDTLSSMHGKCERLHQDVVGTKTATGVTQTGALIPSTRKPIEDGVANKVEVGGQDLMMKRLDEISVLLQENAKLNLQVQSNTRELNELKKKHETLQLDFIQAQNDLGRLQQDLVRMNARLDGTRIQSDSNAGGDRSRQSLALPLPPETQANAAIRSTQGTLKLVNSYPMTVSVVVDGQYYTLRTGDSLSLNRNPGYVTYEVIGIQGNTLRAINAAETLTVQIVPR